MATIAQLTTQRATAGARYAAAVAELHAALVDLAALDGVLNNAAVTPAGSQPTPTFNDPPDSLPWPFCHPVYAPRTTLPNWREEVTTARAVYLASVTAP